MATNLEKQTYITKMVVYIILVLGNIWFTIDSFREYAGTLKAKTLLSGIFFLAMMFWFACQAFSEYKSHKIRTESRKR